MDGQNPVRVLNLFTILNRGGAETMVMNYYRHIDRTRVQFDFLVHREERGAYEDEIESLGGHIFRMMPVRPWTAGAYRRAIRVFFSEHPEYRILHAHMSELGLYAFQEAKRMGIPVRICHAHNAPHGIDLKSPVRWYMKTRMRPYITHRFMCGYESGLWLFGSRYRDSFIQMNNAVDAAAFRYDAARRAEVRRMLELPEGSLTVGHVGRFNYQKNHPFLLRAFAAVRRQEPGAVLLLVGDGSDRPAAETLARELHISDSVRFLGIRTDIPDLLQAMDVFAFPSHFEGLSVASVEAQAAGLPCLISDGVPIECKKTDLVHAMPLSAGTDAWGAELLRLARTGRDARRDTSEEIRAAGFDITENARWLRDFYLGAVGRS